MLDFDTEHMPVLVATYDLLDETVGGTVEGDDIAARLGREPDDSLLYDVFRRLDGTGYINVLAWGGGMALPSLIEPTEKGLQILRAWPGSETDAELLLRLLDERIADESIGEERTRLERFRDAAAELGKGALLAVLTTWATRIAGPR
jgi:hypothetical protein